MDNQMVYDLFSNTIDAATVMGEETVFVDSLRAIASQLAPMQVRALGTVQEWLEDWDNPRVAIVTFPFVGTLSGSADHL